MYNTLKDKIKLVKLLGGSEVRAWGKDENNLGDLKYLIKYYSKIKDQGLINDEKFKFLVVAVCQNFIGNEIEARVNKKIINGISSLFSFSQHATQ